MTRENRRAALRGRGRGIGLAALAGVGLAGLGIVGLGLVRSDGPAPSPPVEEVPEAEAVVAPPPTAPAPVAAPPAPTIARPEAEALPEPEPPAPELLELEPKIAAALENVDPETRARWAREVARQQAAQVRFEQGLEASQVRARDVDARLRDALRRVELVPELLDGGLMTGLRIQSIEPGSPLAEAGLRAGDLLVRIGTERLDDPAMLPRVLADAGPEPSLCVERDGGELCRDVDLR